MIFNRRKEEEVTLVGIGDGSWVTAPMEVGKYIDSLKLENTNLKRTIELLKEELNVIKPMIAEATFKQAMTTDCINCKYVAISSRDERILCCMKDNVCDDFIPREGESDD